MNMPGFFGWWLNGRVLKRSLLPERQLRFYDRVIPLVKHIEKFVVPPFGQSLIAVAVKPK
jgi:hypothetical protein